jgi:hypothetical protein
LVGHTVYPKEDTVKGTKDQIAIKEHKSSMIDLVARSKGTFFAPRELVNKIEVLAPQAVDTLEQLMSGSKTDSVRLKAAVEILALAGVTKETRLTISTDVKDMSEKEINTRLESLLGAASEAVEEADYTEVEDGK